MTNNQQLALEALIGRALTSDEITTLDPHVAARSDGAIADILSVGRTILYSRMTSSRGVAELYPLGPVAAEAVLLKLEGAAAILKASAVPGEHVLGSLLTRQLGFLAGEGLDFGSAALRGMLDSFVPSILTAEEVAGLKSIAYKPDPLPVAAVSNALNAVELT